MSTMQRLRGLRSLVGEAVEHGSKAVEQVHKATAARTFVVLEAIPPLAKPARVAHAVHDASLTGVYGAIRLVNRAVGAALDVAIAVAEERAVVLEALREGEREQHVARAEPPQPPAPAD